MMLDLLCDIASGLRSHPGRTLLSFAGIAVGTASLTVLLNVTQSLQQKAARMQEDFGTQVYCITGDGGDGAQIQQRHLDVLKTHFPASSISALRTFDITEDDGTFKLVATDEHLLRTRPWTMKSGRFLDAADIEQGSHFCVLSRAMAQRDNLSLGDIIYIRGVSFEVLGIIHTGGQLPDADDRFSSLSGLPCVFVPHTVQPFWIDQHYQPAEYFDTVYVSIHQANSIGHNVTQAKQLLSSPALSIHNCQWITPDLVTERIEQWQRLIKWSAGGIAILCLIMGGVTLMSLMVSTINARIPEIGLRMALGAGRHQIVSLFLAEAAVITLCASLAGIACSDLTLLAAQSSVPLQFSAWLTSSTMAFGITLTLSGIFAIWPTAIACRISPAEALRNE